MNDLNEDMLLTRLSEMVSFAEYLPLELITQRNSEPKYPETVGEHIVNYSLDIIIRHDWTSENNERIVEPLLDALNQLDTGVDQPRLWNELFMANRRLHEYLGRKA